MTTDQRRRVIFPRWHESFAVHWRTEKGSVLTREGRPVNEYATAIEYVASRLALRESRGQKPDDFRYAANYLSTSHLAQIKGRKPAGKLSSKDLDEAEIDHFLTLCDLLLDPDNVEAVKLWLNPDEGQRARIVYGLSGCGVPESTLRGWCYWANKDHGSDWRSLPIEKLQAFARYAWGRSKGWKRPKRPKPPAAQIGPASR